MTDRPIIFSAPMVRALLDGRKTMTRRLALSSRMKEVRPGRSRRVPIPSPWQKAKPGDRLWVRENFTDRFVENDHCAKWVAYAADGLMFDHATGKRDANVVPLKMRPSIHMPRWASRLTLVVTAVRIEPLQNISDADAKAEGIYLPGSHELYTHDPAVRAGNYNGRAPAGAFKNLWCEINGPDSWSANPEVVALTFEVHKANIDAMQPSDKRTNQESQK